MLRRPSARESKRPLGATQRSGMTVSPNSSVIHCERRASVTSSNRNNCGRAVRDLFPPEAGSPEIVNKAIRYNAEYQPLMTVLGVDIGGTKIATDE